MTTVPLPSFLPVDALDDFRKFDGPLIYLAAPLGHPDPSVRQERFESVNRYCGYLIRQHKLVFSPLSLGASLGENAISNSALVRTWTPDAVALRRVANTRTGRLARQCRRDPRDQICQTASHSGFGCRLVDVRSEVAAR